MILIFAITQSNVDDQERHKNEGFLKAVFGKLLADKGYISQKLTDILFVNDIHLLTSIRNNIKNSLMTMSDKIMLRKRSVIETVKDELKNICQIEHSRHRTFVMFVSNIVAGLTASAFFPKKPEIEQLLTILSNTFDKAKVNFDLQDCERILRVEAEQIDTKLVCDILTKHGHHAEFLL